MSIEEHREHLRQQPEKCFRGDNPKGIAVISELGAPRNQERATHAYLNDADRRHYRLEETEAGKYLSGREVSRSQARALRDEAQLRMAQAARGQVEVYAMDAGPGSAFRREIMPALIANEQISHINNVPREFVARLPEQQRFSAICASEMIRDKQRGFLPDPARPGSLYYGDPREPPQPRPRGPAEADPHRPSPDLLKMFYKLDAAMERQAREERLRQREAELGRQQRTRSDSFGDR